MINGATCLMVFLVTFMLVGVLLARSPVDTSQDNDVA
jgi:hypothetical protein